MTRMCLRWILLAFFSGWFGAAFGVASPMLTDAQRQWLAEHPNLRIGFTSIPPQVFRNPATGELTGLCIDYLDAVESKIGYRFERRYYTSWQALMDALEANEIDVVYAAQKTSRRIEKYLFTKPYLTFQNMIFTQQGVEGTLTLQSLYGKRVAVVRGAATEEVLVEKYPAVITVPVDDELTGLLKLSFDEVDAMVVEPSRASWIVEEKKITNLHVAGQTDIIYRLGYMVGGDLKTLPEILDAGIGAVTEEEYHAMIAKWIHPPRILPWRQLWWTLGAIGSIIVSVALWNLTLHNRIAVRTRQLSNELERRKRAEKQRNVAEEQFRHIIEFSPLGVHTWRLESDGRLILTGANTAAEKILKLDHHPLIGKDICTAFPGFFGTELPDIYKRVCTVGIPFSDVQYAYRDNQIAGVYEVFAFQIAPGQMAAMFIDVSDRVRIQQELTESERRLSTLMGNLPGVAYRCKNHPDWPFEFINKGALDLTGYTENELLSGKPCWNDLIVPDDRQRIWDEVQTAIAARRPFQLEYQITTRDGQPKWVWEQGCGIYDDAGNVVALEGLVLDITVRKQAKQELQFFQFAVDHSGESAYWMDSDSRFIYVNDAACRELGYTREELLKLSVANIDPDFPADRWPSHWQELREKGTLRFESRHKAKDGTLTPIEVSANYVNFEGKEYNCAFVQEISERKQFERAIDAFVQTVSSSIGQDMFRDFAGQLAAQLGADMVILGRVSPLADESNTIQTLAVFKDGAMIDDYAYSFVGTPCEKTLLGNEAISVIKDNLAEQYPQNAPIAEQQFRSYISVPLRDVNGRRLGLICAFFRKPLSNTTVIERIFKIFASQAVMELQRMEGQQKLAHSEYRFREMFARMRSAVAIYKAEDDGRDFVFTDFNPAAERTEKIDKQQLIGRRITEVFPGIEEFGLLEVFRNVWKTGVAAYHPVRLYKDNRIASWRENYVYKLPTGEIVALYDDVTERIVAEQAREKLIREIQTKNNELESIVFVASHDLRSPLINIQGFAGELAKSCCDLTVLLGRETLGSRRDVRQLLDEDIPESLGFISAGAAKMDALVKGLLQIARIGTIQLHIDRLDINQLMANILKTVQYQTREYDIDIRLGDLPPCLGDWTQLNQVFSNLIDNAIKYRHPDRRAVIEIDGQLRKKHAIYTIRDNGVGIEPEHCEKIFEVFHRLNPAGPVKGEGLGLTIVRRTLDRMNGKITVESTPNQGAAFIVDLPAAE